MNARFLISLSTMLLAGGCGLPPAITAMTYAADGLSYAASGKGMADHAISTATQKDCAMFRIVRGDTICRNDEEMFESPVLAMVDTEEDDRPRVRRVQTSPGPAASHTPYKSVRRRGSWEIDASLDVESTPRKDRARDMLIRHGSTPR